MASMKLASSEAELRQQYEEKWDPVNFMEVYINSKSPWEEKLVPELHHIIQRGKVKGTRVLDIGCGPTIHRAAILARICDEILVCDLLPKSLTILDDWLKGKQSHMYSVTLNEVARLEDFKDTESGEIALNDRVPSKVKHLVQVDVTCPESTKKLLEFGGQFDVAQSNGCLESASLTYETYLQALRNVASLLKPGGAFLLSGYTECPFYVVNSTSFRCLYLTGDQIRKGLEETGFRVDILKCFKIDSSENYGDLTYGGKAANVLCLKNQKGL